VYAEREERIMTTATGALAASGHEFDPGRGREEYAAGVELRLAKSTDDDASVRRLTILDEAPDLVGPVLLALVNGEAVAGLALRSRDVVANPFVSVSDAVALLRMRADHLTSAPAHRRGRRRGFRRAA
jgi:hypothetical protein